MSTINGTNGDDLIDESGATSKVKIKGKDGDDTLIGGSGNDDIKGQDGNDELIGNAGNDKLNGGDGDDTIEGGDGEDDIKGGKGKDTVLGGKNDDEIDGGSGDDFLDGGEGDDEVEGGSGNDTIDGGLGNDELEGDGGDDVITGGAGDDEIEGGSGDDTLEGGLGDDTIDGGSGTDTAVFEGSILDFAFSTPGGSSDDDDDDDDDDDLLVTDTNPADGDQGTDLLQDVEILQFDDFTLDLENNNAPLVVAANQTTGENSTLGFAIQVYDFDGDTAVLTAFSITGGGSLTLDGAPTAIPSPLGAGLEFGFSFDPGTVYDALAVGESTVETVSVTLDDGNGGITTKTFDLTITGENDAPVALDIAAAANEDGPAVDLTADATDPDTSDTLTYSVDDTGTLGTVTNNNDGTFTYDPAGAFESLADGETATDTFTYSADDGNGGTSTATATVTITGQNDAPTAGDDAASTDEDSSVVIAGATLLANDTDPDASDVLSIASIDTTGTTGTVTDNLDGTFTYDPGSAFNGLAVGESATDTFDYTVADGNGGTDVGTVTVTITGVNDAPTAQPIAAAANEDGPAVDLTADATDPDTSDTLTYSIDDTGTLGTVTNNNDGTFTYDPAGAFESLADGETTTDTFTYTADDGNGGTSTATATVTITGQNDAPTAGDDAASTDEDSSVVIAGATLLANDTDPDASDVLSIASIDTTGTTGTVTDNLDGTFTYDPNGAFETLAGGATGTDTFDYTVDDGNGGTDTGTVTVTITGVNDAPVAAGGLADQTADDAETVSIPTAGDFSDIDGDTLSYSASGLPAGLSINSTTGVISGTIDNSASQVGGGIYTVIVTASDGSLTADSSFTITVSNPGPTANDDGGALFTTDEDSFFTTGSVLTNDVDPDGDTLFVDGLDTTGTLGTVLDNGNGSYLYDPNGAFDTLPGGATATDTFSYTVSDFEGGTDTATVTITITGVNDAPSAAQATFDTIEDQEIEVIDLNTLVTDPDTGDVLTISNVTLLPGGAISSINEENGVVSFDTLAFNSLSVGDSESFQIQYTVTDDSGAANNSAVETLTVNINGLNDRPVAGDSTGSADETTSTPFSIDLSTIASDPDANDTLSYNLDAVLAAAPIEGTVAPETFTTFTLTDFTVGGTTYAPGDQVGLTEGDLVVEADGSYNFVPVLNYVGPVPTVSFNGSGTDLENLAFRGDATETGNLDLPGGFALTTFNVNGFTYTAGSMVTTLTGTLTVNADGSYTYVPTIAASNTFAVTYTATGTGSLDLAADGTTREIPVFSTLVGSVLTIDAAEFGLKLGEERDFIVQYTATDDSGAVNNSDSGEIIVTVTGEDGGPADPTNNQPVADDALLEEDDETEINVDLLALVTDADAGDELSIVSVVIEAEGREDPVEFEVGEDGTLTIDPTQLGLADGEQLTLVATYTVDDGSGQSNSSDSGQVTIVITGTATGNPNNMPVAQNDTIDVNEADGNVVVDLNALISDVDVGDVLTITDVAFGGEEGELEADFTLVNGVVTVDPTQFGAVEGETITVSFGYTVDDGSGAPNSSATGLVTLNITGAPAANAAPVAEDDTLFFSTAAQTGVSINLAQYLSDPDGDPVSVVNDATLQLLVGGIPATTQPNLVGTTVFVDFTQFALGEDDALTAVMEYNATDGSLTDAGEITFELVGNAAPEATPLTVSYNLDVDTGNISIDLNALVSDPDPAPGDTLTINVISFEDTEGGGAVSFTNVGNVIELDPTQFGLVDGESTTAALEFTVDDGNGFFNSITNAAVTVNVTNPEPVATDVTLHFDDLDDGEPNNFTIEIGSYEGFVFGPNAVVIQTDEVPGRGAPIPYTNGDVSEFNVLSNLNGDILEIYGQGAIIGEGAVEGADFDLESAFLSGVWRDGMTVTVTGFTLEGAGASAEYVATGAGQIFTASTGAPVKVFFDDAQFDAVSYVTFEVTGGTSAGLPGDGTQIMLDDVFIFL
ncbi:MAG: Ig-like domain-containing protein [Rhodobacter sp.]|nr:Ig-like domain-containing protein [Rhodobacter sp.]